MPEIQRRTFLGGLGATAAASLVGCRPGEPVEPGTIEHVVLVMMENRSFDHYLGALSLEEGRTDIDGLAPGMTNPDPTGGDAIAPFHSDAWCLPDPPHGWASSHRQFAGGAMSGFTSEYFARHGHRADPAWVMGYHGRDDLPVTYALSDAYTTCERWFSSLMCGTWPNRLYALAGESQGVQSNRFPSGGTAGYTIPTIFERLDTVGATWGAYSSNASSLWLFEALRDREELRSIDDFHWHASSGQLPAVSWVEPAFGIADDHPPVHPLLGQLFLASVHEALATSPLWDRTLLVVYYDEHGGFYDHVPPPTAPDDRADEGFDQLGFRIPALVAGPWVRPGHVSDLELEHTSPLAHLERTYGLDPLTTRTASANDLTDLLDQERMASGVPYAPAVLPTISLTEDEIRAQCESADGRSLDQPLLERALDLHPAPPHLDRRDDPEGVVHELLAHARRLGVLTPDGAPLDDA